MADFSNIDAVIANLVVIQQVIVATEDLLSTAIDHSKGSLKQYFIEHLEEERNHQSWLADDLLTADVDVTTIPVLPCAMELAGSQYYLIKHVSPLALLGYMAVLEGFPISIESVELLEKMHGKELFKTLRYHGEHDLEHRKELFAIIDDMPLGPVMHSAIHAAKSMNKITEHIADGSLAEIIKGNV